VASARTLTARAVSLAVWAFATWLLLTWTVTAEQLVTGALAAIAVGVALCPLGDVIAPWRLLDPRRLRVLLELIAVSAGRIVRANLSLARRIWTPSLPLASGMVIVPTALRDEQGAGAAGLITSLIVDTQVVDVDLQHGEVQYHVVSVPPGSKREQAEAINAPTERLVSRLTRRNR
jgi:multicomponent Na+:H+ antiporter subunit E